MNTLKSILRNAASMMLAVIGLLVLFVVIGNILDWEWSRRAKQGFTSTSGAIETTLPSAADSLAAFSSDSTTTK